MAQTSRRKFIAGTALLAGAAVVRPTSGAPADAGAAASEPPGDAPVSIVSATFAEAEKLAEVRYSPAERSQAASSWEVNFGALLKDRRAYHPTEAVVPASLWDPRIPGAPYGPSRTRTKFSRSSVPLPAS